MELYQLQNFFWCCFNEPEWADEWLKRMEENREKE